MPAITIDSFGNTVIMWTNEETFTTSYQGITYTNMPEEEITWQENAVIMGWSMENPVAWDVATITGDYYSGLAGGAYDYSELSQIGFQLDDITDIENTLAAWTWSGENDGFISHEIIDQECITEGGLTGWTEAIVFHFADMGYDLPGCPNYFRTDPIAMSGSSFFDGNTEEDTSPSNAYDYFIKDDMDTSHHVMTNDETGRIVWKMAKLSEEPDIEYTPYQKEIGDGAYGQMAGNANTVLITAIDGGSVKAFYSTDDGENWGTSTIGPGNFANLCELNGVFYCVYTNNNNLFLSTSEDGGATWSSGTQVNDVDGTVVDQHKYFDVHQGGIVWTDERNEDWDVYYSPLESGPAPIIVVEDIGGGFGVSATIKNIGDADATNVQWSITAEGTVFVGGEKTGSIASIAPGGSAAISSFLLGFGDVSIDILAECDEGSGSKESVSGKLLLFFLQM